MINPKRKKLEHGLVVFISNFLASIDDIRNLELITVLDAKVSKDKKYIDVHITSLNSQKRTDIERETALHKLSLERQIYKNFSMRLKPDIRIKWDSGWNNIIEIEQQLS